MTSEKPPTPPFDWDWEQALSPQQILYNWSLIKRGTEGFPHLPNEELLCLFLNLLKIKI